MYQDVSDILKYVESSTMSDYDKRLFKDCVMYVDSCDQDMDDMRSKIKQLEETNEKLAKKLRSERARATALTKSKERIKLENDSLKDQIVQLKEGMIGEDMKIALLQRNNYREQAKRYMQERDEARRQYQDAVKTAEDKITKLKIFLNRK